MPRKKSAEQEDGQGAEVELPAPAEEAAEVRTDTQQDEGLVDDLSVLDEILRAVAPKRNRHGVIKYMEMTDTRDLRALKVALQYAGWPQSQIKMVIETYGRRIGASEDEIRDAVEYDIGRWLKESGYEEDEVEEAVEDIEEEEEEVERPRRARRRRKRRSVEDELAELRRARLEYLRRLSELEMLEAEIERMEKRLSDRGKAGKKENEGEEEKTYTYVLDGVPMKVTKEEYLALKRWEKEREEKKENERKTDSDENVTWVRRNGETITIPKSALPYVIMQDAMMSEIASLREELKKLHERNGGEREHKTITIGQDGKIEVSADMAPWVMMYYARERDIERLEREIEELKNEARSIDPFETVQHVAQAMEKLGWQRTGSTQWDVIGAALNRFADSVAIIGSKYVQGGGQFNPVFKYSDEERAAKFNRIISSIEEAERTIKAENKLLKSLEG